jgi:16S rRNA (guanine(966)-N(2))-methyltransferase RsmD
MGKVRIIGGTWRGRNLSVEDAPGLRPSADRVRETLFNLLGQRLDDLICVDCFAGTGVLGLEALSRGAQQVHLLEKAATAYKTLEKNISSFKLEEVTGELILQKTDALIYLAKLPPQSIDIFFIDPPFAQTELLHQALLQAQRILRVGPKAAIYLEHPSALKIEELLTELKLDQELIIKRSIRSGQAIGTLLVPKNI